MKTKLGFIILGMFLFIRVLGYSSDPGFNYPPVNNLVEFCYPCEVAETAKVGAGSDGPLTASAAGTAWKDGAEFKWRANAGARNEDDHIKGQYSLCTDPPHDSVIVLFRPEDFVNVNPGIHRCYFDTYEGEIEVVLARLSTQPFNNQNAIMEVDTISASAHISGRPLSDNARIITPTHIARSATGFDCGCDENDEEKDNDEDEQGDLGSNTPGIFLADSDQIPEPGDSVTLNLVTSEPYYDVSWYVHTPWDTSSSGTYQENVSGDGTSTETSLSYTFPSGAMHTGDFVFRAVIYRWSDMSSYEETYTVTVSNPTTPGLPLSVSASPGPSRWTVSLSWAAPSSDGGSTITGYQYQYRRYYVGTWRSWSSWQSVSSTSTTVTGLISNGTYEFRVRAVNSVGAGSITGSVTTTAN